jgi:hypothetical protein
MVDNCEYSRKPLPAKLWNRGTVDWNIHSPHTVKKFLKKF